MIPYGWNIGKFCVPLRFVPCRFSSSVLLDTSCGLFQSGTIPEAGIGTGTRQWNIQHFSNSGGSSADFRDTFPTASLCFFPKMGSGGGPKTLPIKLGSNPWFRLHMTPWKYGSQPHLRGGEDRWIKATAGMGQIGGRLGVSFI